MEKTDMGAQERQLPSKILRESFWCGLVFGLAVLLVAINAFPPFRVAYKVQAGLLVPSDQVTRLQNASVRMGWDGSEILDNPARQANLEMVHVVGRANGKESATGSQLIRVQSRWSERVSPEVHQQWLVDFIAHGTEQLHDTAVAKHRRFSRWEARVAKHYVEQAEFRQQDAQRSTGLVFELRTERKGPQASLASYASRQGMQESDYQSLLENRLHQKKKQLDAAEREWEKSLAAVKQDIEITGETETQLQIGRFPTVSLFALLLLACFSGGSVSLLVHKVQAGGVFSPQQTAMKLVQLGIPVAGHCRLTNPLQSEPSLATGVTLRIRRVFPFLIQNATRISEWLLAFWGVLFVYRVSTDALWRQLVIEQPLVGLAKLLTGLP